MSRSLFSYIDWHFSTSEFTAPWKRIHMSQIDVVRGEAKNHNVFTTIQYFKNDKQADGELQFVPLFFDLDYKDDVDVALRDCRALVDYFRSMDLGQEHIRVWFSGSKGFHIVVTPELFGIKPHAELTYIVRNACTYVANKLQLRSFDTRVYSIRRMWRMAGSVHQKTGLHCTEISHQELQLDLDGIKELARNHREDLYEESEYEHVDELPTCVAWFAPFISDYESMKELQNLRPRAPITSIPGENPVCINDLLTNSIRKPGTRNQGEMALVSYYRDTGMDEKTAFAMVSAWAHQIPKGMTSKTDTRSLDADVKGVVKTFYDKDAGDKHRFACAYIRSLGTGTDKPIACNYELCKFVKQADQETEEAIVLKLPEASRSSYIKKKIKMDVMISGREDTPYGVPVHLMVECQPDLVRENSVCKQCPIAIYGGKYEFTFSAKNQSILNLLDTSQAQQAAFLRKRCGIPERCNRHRMKVLEYTNIIEVTAIPRIDFRPDTITEEEPYVLRRGLFVGHDIEANKEYNVIAYTYPDPKTQHLVHVIEEAQQLTDDISMFKQDDETMAALKKFEISTAITDKLAAIDERIDEIYSDLEQNIVRVWGRRDTMIAVDLVYHSVLSFFFQDTFIQRGYLELLVIGDSGQAKTETLKKMRSHYELGEIISGETASRTGLVYSIQENNRHRTLQWGAIPLNDRRILIIDEFSGVAPEEVENMSSLRASGIAEVNRSIKAKTASRTRLIFLSNSRDGRMLAEYQCGVEAIDKLFTKKEDIRRLDFAVTVASSEVATSEINRKHKSTIEHKFVGRHCRSLILWAWSRKPNQIVYTEAATEKILDLAGVISKEYHASIPLVEPADMRIKLARLSAALAARLHSTSDGENLVVLPEHVTWIYNFLSRIYRKPSMAYNLYSQGRYEESLIKDEKHVRSLVSQHGPDFMKRLLQLKQISISDIEVLVNDRDKAKNLLTQLYLANAIKKVRSYYVNTAAHIVLLKRMISEVDPAFYGERYVQSTINTKQSSPVESKPAEVQTPVKEEKKEEEVFDDSIYPEYHGREPGEDDE